MRAFPEAAEAFATAFQCPQSSKVAKSAALPKRVRWADSAGGAAGVTGESDGAARIVFDRVLRADGAAAPAEAALSSAFNSNPLLAVPRSQQVKYTKRPEPSLTAFPARRL